MHNQVGETLAKEATTSCSPFPHPSLHSAELMRLAEHPFGALQVADVNLTTD